MRTLPPVLPLVFDGHNDLPWELRLQVGGDLDRLDIGRRVPTTATDLPRLREGGVGAQFWSVYAPSNLPGDLAVTQTLEQVDLVHRLVRRYADDLTLATTADEVETAMAAGRIASLMGAEGGQSIGSSLGALRTLYRLGVRYLTLTHNDNVPWADSATDVPVARWADPVRREVVREMNRLGMLVDLSHVSTDTMRQALDVAEAPVIFSHSCARAVTDSPRNVPDDVLAAMAAGGGVCMVDVRAGVPHRGGRGLAGRGVRGGRSQGIEGTDFPTFMAWAADYTRAHPKPPAHVEDVVRHVEHVREVAGVDHVGLGGDYDGTDVMPVGLEDVTGYPTVLTALAERGWSDDDLARVAHRNAVRVLRDAEATAGRLEQQRAPSTATIRELDGPPAEVSDA